MAFYKRSRNVECRVTSAGVKHILRGNLFKSLSFVCHVNMHGWGVVRTLAATGTGGPTSEKTREIM
eukprot:8228606-Pyramimonas_sp.AAC.1